MKTVLPVCVLLLAALGCERADVHNRQAISGDVQFRGQPLDKGVIDFLPVDVGTKSGGRALIADGKYVVPREQGLAPGKYRVTIASPEANTTDPPAGPPGMQLPPPGKERIPARYNTESQLTVEVQAAGDNKFDFTIDEDKP